MTRRLVLVAAVAALALPAATAAGTAPLEFCASDKAVAPKLVRFRTADGARLLGVALGNGRVGVVLSHQLGSDFCEWVPYARQLSREGYRVLAFSFRGSGSSDAGKASPARLDRDVIAAAGELRRLGARRVVIVGASMGGTASLVAAPVLRPAPKLVVSLSGPSYFGGLDASKAMPRFRGPALFAAAADDNGFPSEARTLYKASPSPAKRLLIVGGADHGSALVTYDPQVRQLLQTELDKYAPTR
jgi:pimeloyl-ACP methyl ester carboxylesterase